MDDETPTQAPIGFEKMRAMLGRAAELRADEQRQVVDLIDDLRSRIAPIDERVRTLPDRNEVSVIAERLDEALSRIDHQDEVLRQVSAELNGLSERVGRPLDALEARLDGVAGRFEGVAGRLDGLDDRLQHLHARLDEIDTALGRVHSALEALPAQLDIPAVHRRFDELASAMHQRFDDHRSWLNGRVDDISGRLSSVDESVRHHGGTIAGSLDQGIDKLHDAVHARPDRDEFARTLRKNQQESERRITHQLDGVLADFAEVMIGQGGPARVATNKGTRKAAKKSGEDEE